MDDPLLAFRGSDEYRLHLFSVAFLWFEVTGFPVAWHKVSHGASVDWIGGRLERTDKGVTASIPEAKTLALTARSVDILHRTTITLRELRSFTGAVSFVAGIIPHLRPFLAACWASIAHCNRRPSSDLRPTALSTSMAKKRRLPGNMMYVCPIWLNPRIARDMGSGRLACTPVPFQ